MTLTSRQVGERSSREKAPCLPGGRIYGRERQHSIGEQRLLELRREAELGGEVKGRGVRPRGAPFPMASPETGYYGLPLLKQPSWTWEVPLYFFVGGAAGAAAVVGAIADYTGADRKLVRDARWIAAAGSVISPALLISDLGRPERFLNMLRVFKPRKPDVGGVWTLVGILHEEHPPRPLQDLCRTATDRHCPYVSWRTQDRQRLWPSAFPFQLYGRADRGYGDPSVE